VASCALGEARGKAAQDHTALWGPHDRILNGSLGFTFALRSPAWLASLRALLRPSGPRLSSIHLCLTADTTSRQLVTASPAAP
jgi:hypothetical protein